MIESRIIGRSGVDTADVSSDGFLYTISRDLYETYNYIDPFTNDTFGNNMAINASPSGTPEPIHNGTDDVYWTGSAISGIWDFASTTQFYDGSKSVDGTQTLHNNSAQFAKGSDIDLTNYSSIGGWIYISSWSLVGTKELNIFGWDTSTGTQVGASVDIGDYISKSSVGVWQKFTIPLIDMSLNGQTIDSIRINTVYLGGGNPVDFYLDYMTINSAGSGPGNQTYSVFSQIGQDIFINKICWNFVSAYDITLANASVPNLSYDKIINQTLLDGMVYREIVEEGSRRTVVIKNLLDLLENPSSNVAALFCDGTNTYLKVEWTFIYPILLHYNHRNKITINISDDLSGFKEVNVTAMGGTRSNGS